LTVGELEKVLEAYQNKKNMYYSEFVNAEYEGVIGAMKALENTPGLTTRFVCWFDS
jgi:hypothetical protein